MCGIWRGAKGKCCMKKIFEKLKQNFLSCLLFVKLINYNFEYSIKCNKFKYFKIIILFRMKTTLSDIITKFYTFQLL